MAILDGAVGGLYVVRMQAHVDRSDVDAILRGAEQAARGARRKITYIGINGADSEAPSSEVRQYILARADDLFEHASTLEIVLEGDGLKAGLLRTIVRGMITVARTRNAGPRRAFIHSSVEDGITRVQRQLDAPRDEIEARLRMLGLMLSRTSSVATST